MQRVPMQSYTPVDPRLMNNFIDSCAFDPKCSPEDTASNEIFELYNSESIILIISHSVMKEIDHPNTPIWVKKEAQNVLFSYAVPLNEEQKNTKEEIFRILTGNGTSDKMKQDAEHVYHAAYSHGYFITTDNRILKRRNDIQKICNVSIFKPSEWLQLYSSNVGT